MALTPEEIQEMKDLEELEQLEQLEARSKNFAPTVEEMDEARAATEPTTGEALSAGFVKSIPFLKDAVSAYDGIADSMEEGASFDKAYSNYKENLDGINAGLQNAEQQSPYTFAAGEIAGTAAGLVGAGAALGATKTGAALTGLGKGVVAGAGVGAAQNLSSSEDRGVSDLAVGAVVGAGSELGGHYVMKGVKKGGKYLLDKAEDANAFAVKKILGIGNVSTKKALHKHLKRTGQKESEFLSDILTQRMDDGGETVLNFGEKPELMLDKISVRQDQIGSKLGKAYKALDEKYKVEVSIEDLKQSLSDKVSSSFHNSDDPGMNQIGVELDDYIRSIGRRSKGIRKEITPDGTKIIEDIVQDEKWGLTRVHGLQKDIRKRIEVIYNKNGLDLTASKEQQRKIATSLGEHIDEILESVTTEADDVIGGVKNLRKQYGNMASIEESLESELFRSSDDPISLLKESLGFRSLLISGAASSAFGPAGLVAGPVLNRVMNSPKTPLYLSEGVKKIGQVLSAAPSGEIAAKLNTAALMNNERFETTLYGLIGEISLKQSPLQRSSADVKAKQTDIRNYIKSNQPSLLKEYDEVMESGDANIASFMDGVSKIPALKNMFAPGIGFDGKVYSPEDKAQLELQLKKSNIPGAQRIQLMEDLRDNGTIPDMNKVVEPLPQGHVPRTKKIHDY